MTLSEEQKVGLGFALNEASLLGLEVRPDGSAAATLAVLSLPPQGPPPPDPRVQLRFAPVGRVVASLRLGRWDDPHAQVVPFPLEKLLEVVEAFGHQPIYGWEFFDVHERTLAGMAGRHSLDFRGDPLGLAHSLSLFQEGPDKHLEICLWFADLTIRRPPAMETVHLDDFIAGGKRWWDGLHAGDPRTMGHGIVPGNRAPPVRLPDGTVLRGDEFMRLNQEIMQAFGDRPGKALSEDELRRLCEKVTMQRSPEEVIELARSEEAGDGAGDRPGRSWPWRQDNRTVIEALQQFLQGHRSLPKALPELPALLDRPRRCLADREIRIGPIKRYRLALFSLVWLVLMLVVLASQVAEGAVDVKVPLLAVALAVGVVIGLWPVRAEVVLRGDGIELVYGDASVWCPWALFKVAGQAFHHQGKLTLPIAAEAVPAVELRHHGVCTTQGWEVRSRHWQFLEHHQARFSAKFSPYPQELGGLLLHLGRALGSGPAPAATPSRTPSQPARDGAERFSRSPGGWITVPLTHLRFSPHCCSCNGPTGATWKVTADERFAFLRRLATHRSHCVTLAVPLCPHCQRRIHRENVVGLTLVLVTLLLLGLAGWAGEQRHPGSSLCLLLGLGPVLWWAGRFAFRVLVVRHRPVQVRRYSVGAQTVQIRFRQSDYADRFCTLQPQMVPAAERGSAPTPE